MEAFVDKECWSTIIYKQNALVSGNGATGKLLLLTVFRIRIFRMRIHQIHIF